MDYYDRYRGKYASEEWTFSKSSSRRFAQVPEGYRLGLSRHKSRKLACAHVLLDLWKIVMYALGGLFH
jgi:hypothetical protein